MTKIDQANIETEQEPNQIWRKIAIAIISGLSTIFLSGVLVGFTSTVINNDGLTFADIAVTFVILVLLVAVFMLSKAVWPTGKEELAPSARKSRKIVWIAIAVGLAFGLFVRIGGGGEWDGLFSNGEIPPILAAVSITTWIGIVPLLTLAWWRTVDEHEKDAYREGAMVSSHIYLFIVPSWWLASRAGWVPAQDPMIVLAIISVIWSIIWLYRKYA